MKIFSYYLKNIIISLVALILCGVNWILPFNIMRITVSPAVFETGGDYYNIVWETSFKGSGCVKYTYNGEEKVIWDASNGIVSSDDTVHCVRVPKEELRGNTYTVESQFIAFKFAYHCLKGKSCKSEPIAFDGQEKEDDINILCLSDIHEMEKTAHKALFFHEEKPDLICMIGDITSEMRTKDQFTKFLLKDAADISGGAIPVAFTRGNHETRGEYAAVISDYIGDEEGKFYYTFDFGNLSAIVLDSGEDKEDSHKEYSGLVDFNTLREKEYKWISDLEKKDFDGRYKIVFSHEPSLENHFGMNWHEGLEKLGMELIVGGHHHRVSYEEGELSRLIVGGKLGDEQWASAMLKLKDGKITAKIIDNNGEALFEQEIVS